MQSNLFILVTIFFTQIFAIPAPKSPSIRKPLTYRSSNSASNLLVRKPDSDTRNDLLNGDCGAIIIIFARGTHGTGNIGTGIGPTFINEVSNARPGSVIAQGLPYAADLGGYFSGGSFTGALSMAEMTARAARQCPEAKIVLAGYSPGANSGLSQGAQVTHRATQQLNPILDKRVAAIVTFGDPKRNEAFPRALQKKTIIICNKGDLICDGIPIILGPHLNYEERVPEAVSWVLAHV